MQDKGCEEANTGSITVKNNAKNDIYFLEKNLGDSRLNETQRENVINKREEAFNWFDKWLHT